MKPMSSIDEVARPTETRNQELLERTTSLQKKLEEENARITSRLSQGIPGAEKIGHAAWASADPGIQFHTTINDWHTCPKSGPIRASNPCSEYMFLDDTACNLASLNLMTFRRPDGSFDTEAFEHCCRLWTVVLEISVLMAQFPSKQIAELSYRYRTLGLGFANIGGLLMASGIPYDSAEGRAICGAISAIMTGVSYATSAEMAQELPWVLPATGWFKQHNWVRVHFGPDDDILAELETLRGWLKQSYVAVAPKKLGRTVTG